MGGRKFGAEGHGQRKFHGGEKEMKKDAMSKGFEVLMNRSEMKGIVDPTERSVALGRDMMKKMSSLEGATGKDAMSVMKMIGEKS
jgi:hypothetical protein